MKDVATNLELSVQEVNFLVSYLHFNNSQGRLKVILNKRDIIRVFNLSISYA